MAVVLSFVGKWNGNDLKKAEAEMARMRAAAANTGKSIHQVGTNAERFSTGVNKAILGIGAGLGAVLGIKAVGGALKDMAANAAEDQLSMATLGKTMQNLGLGSAQAEAEGFIKTLSLATGEVDDSLRPALDRLLKSTGSVAEAERALVIAQDAAKSSGRSTLDVAKLLGKAYDGNTMALGRAGLGIDTAILKTGDMAKITAELARLTGGQAATAAATYSGKLERVSTAASEAGETVGYELLKGLDSVSASLGGTDGVISSITAAGEGLASFVAGAADGISTITQFGNAVANMGSTGDTTQSSMWDMFLTVAKLTPGIGMLVNSTEALVNVGEDERRKTTELNEELAKAYEIRHRYTLGVDANTTALDKEASAADKTASALDKIKAALDRVNGKNRSVIEANLNMRELRAAGPTATGERTGKGGKVTKYVTRDDELRYALALAEGSESLSEAYFAKGQGAKGRRALASGRQSIRALGIRPGLASDILSTPNAADPRRAAAARAVAQSVTNINNYNINAELKVASMAELVKASNDAARLAALSRRQMAGSGGVTRSEIEAAASARWTGQIR